MTDQPFGTETDPVAVDPAPAPAEPVAPAPAEPVAPVAPDAPAPVAPNQPPPDPAPVDAEPVTTADADPGPGDVHPAADVTDLVAGPDAPESPVDPAARQEAGLYDVPSTQPDWFRRIIDSLHARIADLESR